MFQQSGRVLHFIFYGLKHLGVTDCVFQPVVFCRSRQVYFQPEVYGELVAYNSFLRSYAMVGVEAQTF